MERADNTERRLAHYQTMTDLLHEAVFYYDRKEDTLYLYGGQQSPWTQDDILPQFCAAESAAARLSPLHTALAPILCSENSETDDLVPLSLAGEDVHWQQLVTRAQRDGAGAIIGRVGCLRAAQADVCERQRLRQRASRDLLTGLYNRYECEERIAAALRGGKPGSLLFLDLDGFKRINDSQGHAQGDLVLQLAAKQICACFRESDEVFRLGGDEFLVWLEGTMEEERMAQLAGRLNAALRDAIPSSGLSVSIGVAVSRAEDSFDSLYARADHAMYQAKRRGNGGYQFARETGEA